MKLKEEIFHENRIVAKSQIFCFLNGSAISLTTVSGEFNDCQTHYS